MSEVRTPPIKLVYLNPQWKKIANGEIWGIAYDCPCGMPLYNPYTVNGTVYPQCCSTGGRQLVPTKTNFINGVTCADSVRRGWDLTGDSFENITLSPSIHQVGHWHGWLRNGMLESC